MVSASRWGWPVGAIHEIAQPRCSWCPWPSEPAEPTFSSQMSLIR